MYNYNYEDWPSLSYDLAALASRIDRVQSLLLPLVERVRRMPAEDRKNYFLDVLIEDAQQTSSIEGEYMSREDIRSSIMNHLSFGNYGKEVRDQRAIGVGKLLSVVAANFRNPLTEVTIKYWHELLFQTTRSIQIIGDYRAGTEPMRIVSGPDYDLTVHYEAPPAKRVPAEMQRFIDALQIKWHQDPLIDQLLRAGVSHVHFESIHPFQDGNGRIGRVIISHLISQGLGFPVPFTLSKVFNENVSDYYAQLQQAQRNLDVTEWMKYFLDCVIKAITNATIQIHFILSKNRFYDQFQNSLSDRQHKVIHKLFDAGPEGFDGGLSAKNYERITRVSKATATRELTYLTRLGALTRTGAGRGVRYQLNLDYGEEE
ncbi:Fic family protein [Lewinella sp. 4G2]|uniref:Fic family protein n=1 Tax=Lewinella sp. 4G2 TaxID=1803372 RepID=UPI0007B4E994|nr:DUF4172 domain-containing protein [Lewinella sp. 4G2]OAV43324.1 hypothetical protein A3850_001905 [Lewinella sp. 4G2]